MCATAKILMLVTLFVAVPAVVHGQAVIAGTVKDPSGGVLPGVVVEAASPALIEKVRSAVTDGNGQYRVDATGDDARCSAVDAVRWQVWLGRSEPEEGR